MDGFIIINKPKGITSHDVCFKLRKVFNTKKIGHTGTLDPLATGVLVCAVGKATKLVNYLENENKTYIVDVLFGIDTDTYDILGKVVKECNSFVLTNEDIDKALEYFINTTTQIPPIYSAIKVKGKKLYDYALENKEVEIEPRPIKIYNLKRISDLNNNRVKIMVCASKGFYVRSLVHDLGIHLNCYATMTELDRIKAGKFNFEEANELDEVIKNIPNLLSIEEVFNDLLSIEVNDYIAKLVKNGVVLDERQFSLNQMFKVYHNNKLIAIYEPYDDKKYKLVVYLGD